jgi:hypothetical protein
VESFASLRSEIALFSADFTNPFVNLNTLSTKKAEPCSSTLFVEVDQGKMLHPLIDEMLRWRNIIGVDYQQYKADKVRQSIH